jgi:HK97 gp10 family phage protein
MDFKVEGKFDENKTKNQVLNDNRLLLFKLMNAIKNEARKEAPVDTGRLRASIHLEPVKPANKIVLKTNIFYSVFQEFGTSRMRGKPFFRPALNRIVRKGVEKFL